MKKQGILIADSGSTKTSWQIVCGSDTSEVLETAGINPVRDKEEVIMPILQEAYRFSATTEISQIYFYGAGCIPPYSTTVKRLLQEIFPEADVNVDSDMMGAAIALCGHHEGIACILGTGANSCLFDGKRIVKQTPALGFILGDEGSGAVLGKRLVSDIFKQQLPAPIIQAFEDETGLTMTAIIDRVYRQPQANLFLASLTPFLSNHIGEPAINELVTEEFRRFLQRNISNYGRKDLPVNFVGGITKSFGKQLEAAINQEGYIMGKTIQKPIQYMADYYKEV